MTGGDAAQIALSWFHAHFRVAAITTHTSGSQLPPVHEVSFFFFLYTAVSAQHITHRGKGTFDVELR